MQIGSVRAPAPDSLEPDDFASVDESPVRCLDAAASDAMVEEINTARKANESLGGVFEVRAYGLVPGVGSYTSWDGRLDGRLAQAIMSIQAMKGVSVGDAFDIAGRVGSEAHDEIFWSEEHGWHRETNRSGGLEGGMTTGETVVVRGAMKPLPTLTKPLRSVDTETKEPAQALRERTDSCTVPAAGVVGEAMVALVLADAYRDKFGGDHIDDVRAALRRLPRADRVEALTAPEAGARSRAFVFVGFMGAGKSTAARAAAAELGVEPLDSDRELERVLGEAIESYFDREGEDAFRAREEEVVLDLLGRPDARVIALGGGALGSERVRDALRGHIVVQLQIGVDEAWRRASGKGRPLARDRGRFEQLKQEREAVYEAMASAWFPPMPREGLRRAMRALIALEQAPAGTRLAWGAASSGDYPVFFGRGLLGSGYFHPPDGRRFVVTDENVMQVLPLESHKTYVFPPGEQEKTLARAEEVLRFLASRERRVTTSSWRWAAVWPATLRGFCASVYQRGMRWVGVPTTLVAQVDSAYGGKTGVDLPEAKNYVGAYHQPSAVLVDPSALETLPPRRKPRRATPRS